MYEQHIFPDGPKIFNRFLNEYVSESNEYYQAWINETRPIYTYETQQQEVQVTVVDPETGEETTVTELQDVQVAVPVMVTNDEGVEMQQTELVHTLRVVSCCEGGSEGIPQPSTQEQIDALLEIIAGA